MIELRLAPDAVASDAQGRPPERDEWGLLDTVRTAKAHGHKVFPHGAYLYDLEKVFRRRPDPPRPAQGRRFSCPTPARRSSCSNGSTNGSTMPMSQLGGTMRSMKGSGANRSTGRSTRRRR